MGRSMSVCKSWCYLLKDPSFLKLHLKCQPLKHLHSVDTKSFRSVRITDKGECFKREFDFPLKYSWVHFRSFIGSYNGLVCIAINLKRNGPNFSSLALWNPTTKEYNIFPEPPKPYITMSELLGFGCDSSLDDYKVLRVVENRPKLFHQADVYSLRSNLWKLLPNAPKLYSYSKRGCALNGCLYFLMHLCIRNSDAGTIVAFSLKDDSFEELPLPPNIPPYFMSLTAMGGRLTAYQRIEQHFSEQYCKIALWTLKEEENKVNRKNYQYSWIKWMNISSIGYAVGREVPNLMKPFCFLNNGKVVLVIEQAKKATGGRNHHDMRFVLFDPKNETGILEDTLPFGPTYKYWPGHVTYTESLVSPHLKC